MTPELAIYLLFALLNVLQAMIFLHIGKRMLRVIEALTAHIAALKNPLQGYVHGAIDRTEDEGGGEPVVGGFETPWEDLG